MRDQTKPLCSVRTDACRGDAEVCSLTEKALSLGGILVFISCFQTLSVAWGLSLHGSPGVIALLGKVSSEDPDSNSGAVRVVGLSLRLRPRSV